MPSTTNSTSAPKRIVIVGAGVGGVAIAARLARSGHSVSAVAARSFAKMASDLIRHAVDSWYPLFVAYTGNFSKLQGPSMLMMPFVFQNTFSDLGVNMAEVLNVQKCETNYKIHFPDNDSIVLSTDMADMKKELERVEEGAFKGFLRFVAEAQYNHDESFATVLSKNYEHWWDFFTIANAIVGLKLRVLDTLWGRVSIYFKTAKLKKAFTFQSMYMGMSPFDAPATYSLLNYSEATDGLLYPIGGFNKVVSELEIIAKSYGASFHYASPVVSVNINRETQLATGVTLADGNIVESDIVICNADLVSAYNQLFPPSPYSRNLQSKKMTCSTISFYWGLRQKLPPDNFHAHNVFIAEDYKESFDSIFKKFSLPDTPSFYIHVPSRMDPDCAPTNCEAVTVLVPTGILKFDSSPETIKRQVNGARETVIAAIQSRIPGCSNFEDWIISETINTPLDWQEKFNLWQGSALGLSHNIMQVIYMRPSMRHADYGNCFFVGASTHPGTGVPVVLCGAKLLESEIARLISAGKGFAREKLFGLLNFEFGVTIGILGLVFAVLVGISAMALSMQARPVVA
ncbi:hypothetical protein HDU83_005485 [Entophlyctis luteolus]|nr:hypothetical protein HDU83_005485 [Entophlyctis luteolus]